MQPWWWLIPKSFGLYFKQLFFISFFLDHSLFSTMCSPCFLMICRASSPYLRPHKLFSSFVFCFSCSWLCYIHSEKPALKCLLKVREIHTTHGNAQCAGVWLFWRLKRCISLLPNNAQHAENNLRFFKGLGYIEVKTQLLKFPKVNSQKISQFSLISFVGISVLCIALLFF